MTGLLLAQATSDNAAEGAYFSLWFPLGLFIIVIAALWTLYARPHQRMPPRRPAGGHRGGPRLEHPGSGYTAIGGTGAAGRRPDDYGESGAQSPPGEGKEAGE